MKTILRKTKNDLNNCWNSYTFVYRNKQIQCLHIDNWQRHIWKLILAGGTQYSLSLTHRHARQGGNICHVYWSRNCCYPVYIEAEWTFISRHEVLPWQLCGCCLEPSHHPHSRGSSCSAPIYSCFPPPPLVPRLATAARVALGGACTYRVEREFHSSWLWHYCHCQCSHSAWTAVTAAARPRAHAWAASGIPLHYEQSFSVCQKNYQWFISSYFI